MESKHTTCSIEIAGNATNKNVMASIGHADGNVWLAGVVFCVVFSHGKLIGPQYVSYTNRQTDKQNQLLNPACTHTARGNNYMYMLSSYSETCSNTHTHVHKHVEM